VDLDAVYVWACALAAEDEVSHGLEGYYVTGAFTAVLMRVLLGARGLVFVVGGRGVGKSKLLRVLRGRLLSYGFEGRYLIWGGDAAGLEGCDVLLVDLPGYGVRGRRRLEEDIEAVERLWAGLTRARCCVVAAPAELMDRGLAGMGTVYELGRLTAGELVGAYRRIWGSHEPFGEALLTRIAAESRGVFRRFKRFIAYVIEEQWRRGGGFTVGLVASALTGERLREELADEVSAFLDSREVEEAARILEALRVDSGINQGELAGRLRLTESRMSRLLGKLEEHGYVCRRRGRRKELRVSLPQPFIS